MTSRDMAKAIDLTPSWSMAMTIYSQVIRANFDSAVMAESEDEKEEAKERFFRVMNAFDSEMQRVADVLDGMNDKRGQEEA